MPPVADRLLFIIGLLDQLHRDPLAAGFELIIEKTERPFKKIPLIPDKIFTSFS